MKDAKFVIRVGGVCCGFGMAGFIFGVGASCDAMAEITVGKKCGFSECRDFFMRHDVISSCQDVGL